MVLSNTLSRFHQAPLLHFLFLIILFVIHVFLFTIPHANSLTFNFTSFPPGNPSIFYQGDAFSTPDGVMHVTKNQIDGSIQSSVGRASYANPVRIWNSKTQQLTDFTTHFSFNIFAPNASASGDGLSFFLSSFNSTIPPNSTGGFLGLFDGEKGIEVDASNRIVAVEFDTFWNGWDPNSDHCGINVNSIKSSATLPWNQSMKDGETGNAWITYDANTFNLSVFLTYDNNSVFSTAIPHFSHVVDLRKILPERIRIGFSAATGTWVETHNVLSWEFSSSLGDVKGNNVGVVAGVGASLGFLCCSIGLIWFVKYRKKGSVDKNEPDGVFDASMNDEFEKGTGPKRFTFADLSQATKNFSEDGKLGEGGFGGVYKGLLSNSTTEIAVKRVSSGSKQGKKEYVWEVRIISRLRHRNLVQLIGWCHEKGEFLLVYEYLPNGSLDSHLFGGKAALSWTIRYKIALGLASSMLYLHEEWEQCVVHRDIKSSNVMLDSNFNAKLGDFGLARFVDHELGSQTTVLAGTMGYMAPECVTTGKASKESDVYSFGVVALEITCVRKPVDPKAEPSRVRLVEWVWELYGKGRVIETADERLNMDYDEKQLECLMIVGLWCCHPDHTQRPSIKQVINALTFEAPLPNLPSKLPVLMYYAPPIDMLKFTYTSLAGITDPQNYQPVTSSSTSNSSGTGGSSKSLLDSHKFISLV